MSKQTAKVVPMTDKAKTLTDLIADLDHLNRLLVKANKLTGRAQERHIRKLCDRQDEAFMAIAHHEAKDLSEFYQKLIVVMQGDDILPRIPEAKSESEDCVNASDDANEALKRSLLADAKRLFAVERDLALLKLCTQYHDNERWLLANSPCDEHGPKYPTWEANVGRRFTMFWEIAKMPALTTAGVAAKASILPYQTDVETSPADDRVEAFTIQLAEDACRVAGLPEGKTAEQILRANAAAVAQAA
jgi:hypothetical protein